MWGKGAGFIELPAYDLKVLQAIASATYGLSTLDLESTFGGEVTPVLKDLISHDLLRVHEQNIKMWLPIGADYIDPPIGNFLVTDTGKAEIKRNQVKRSLTQGEKWKERFWGLIAGLILAAIAWALSKL